MDSDTERTGHLGASFSLSPQSLPIAAHNLGMGYGSIENNVQIELLHHITNDSLSIMIFFLVLNSVLK